MYNDEEVLASMQRTMEERQCRVGSPNGPCGIVEKVYRRRAGRAGYGVKVLMDSGGIRYVSDLDVYIT